MKSLPSGRIVLVEDDRDMRAALVTLLETLGYEAPAFASAELALRDAAFDEAGCMVVDIHLPGMAGTDMVRRLRAAGCLCPVVFITAHDDEHYRTESAALNGELLRKPFAASALKDALQRALIAGKSGP